VGQLGPQILGLGTKLEDLPAYIGKKIGIDADLLRTTVERDELAQMSVQGGMEEQGMQEAA